MIEVDEQIAAVRREVGVRSTASGDRRTLTIAQDFPTDAEDLWDAVTDRDRLPRWFLPVSGALRVGGTYALEGNARGTIEHCDPPRSFALTWEFGEAVSHVEVAVEPDGDDRSRLVLVHVSALDDPTWAEFGPGATGVGWDLSLLGLALHVGSRGAFDPEEGTTWAGEDDGRRFVEQSGRAWCDADVAGGAEPAAARAAAERTTEAYTAEPEGD